MDHLSLSSGTALVRRPTDRPSMARAPRGNCRARWAQQWCTPGGSTVLIRPICVADLSLLREFVLTLSPETKYKRFLAPRTPTDEELRSWAVIDPSHQYSLVAVDRDGGNKLLGEARYVIESADDADVAIVIADRWQGHGLGLELMTRLISAARCEGLHRLTGIALSSNSAVLTLARRLGFRTSRTPGAGWETTVSLDLRS